MKTQTGEITNGILDLCSAFGGYGYIVTANPVAGEEATFESYLRDGFKNLQADFAYIAKAHRCRGRSKRALDILHSRRPSPLWGVEVA